MINQIWNFHFLPVSWPGRHCPTSARRHQTSARGQASRGTAAETLPVERDKVVAVWDGAVRGEPHCYLVEWGALRTWQWAKAEQRKRVFIMGE